MKNKIKPIAIHLPQFHPFKENDEWWGKGFTEWTNVAKAKPRFEEHYQPHLPADLGFYDLRLEEARLAQESLAKEYGIYGFCYYHYWFNGKRLMETPVDRKLNNPKEDFPFMLCWANENWTRAWDGGEQEVLIKQEYSEEDDRNHILHLMQYFKDSRYITIDEKPVFVVYRPALFPNLKKTLEIWREEALKNGLKGIHLGYMQSFGLKESPEKLGFDFAIEFQPNFGCLPNRKIKIYKKILAKVRDILKLKKERDSIYDYAEYIELQKRQKFNDKVTPCVTPMWDNSARRKPNNAFILSDSKPEIFGEWVSYIKAKYPWTENKEKFLFVNAWNEWAEGNHLEPCQKWGLSYLEEFKRQLNNKENY